MDLKNKLRVQQWTFHWFLDMRTCGQVYFLFICFRTSLHSICKPVCAPPPPPPSLSRPSAPPPPPPQAKTCAGPPPPPPQRSPATRISTHNTDNSEEEGGLREEREEVDKMLSLALSQIGLIPSILTDFSINKNRIWLLGQLVKLSLRNNKNSKLNTSYWRCNLFFLFNVDNVFSISMNALGNKFYSKVRKTNYKFYKEEDYHIGKFASGIPLLSGY